MWKKHYSNVRFFKIGATKNFWGDFFGAPQGTFNSKVMQDVAVRF